MRESVKIADDVRKRLDRGHVNSTSSATTATFDTPSTSSVRQRPDHKVCLSLGPYGAMLPYAQEFDAIYPPPFGPCSFDPDTETVQTNSFILPSTPSSEKDTISTAPPFTIPPEELASHSALTGFHLHRLRVFAQDERTWSRIDLVAFETTPLLREAKAIREAVARLLSEMHDRSGDSWAMKPWYISFVFPGGRFPEERWVGGPKYDVRTIVETVFLGEAETSSASSAWATSTNMPSGIGINCTEPKYLPKLIKEMSETLRSREVKRSAASLPWLVVYPNGGTHYDIIHRTWVDQSSSPADKWAEGVLNAVETGITSGGTFSTKGEENVVSSEETGLFTPWGGVLIGGCCKASPAHIAALERRLYPTKGTPLRDREEEGTAQR